MNGSTPILSSQQVTSCTPNPLKCGGTGGRMGSIPQLGYTYIQLFGHVTEDDYPYTSGTTTDTGDCMYDFMNTAPVVGITGYNTMPPNDQEAVMTHLAEKGPLAVAVYASGWGGYGGGVYDDSRGFSLILRAIFFSSSSCSLVFVISLRASPPAPPATDFFLSAPAPAFWASSISFLCASASSSFF